MVYFNENDNAISQEKDDPALMVCKKCFISKYILNALVFYWL